MDFWMTVYASMGGCLAAFAIVVGASELGTYIKHKLRVRRVMKHDKRK